MEACSLQFIAAACAGESLSDLPEARVRRVCTDSRAIKAGDLFFALRGERHDGHDFLFEAAKKGAGAVVVERGRLPADWSLKSEVRPAATARQRGENPKSDPLRRRDSAARVRKECAMIVVEDTRKALGRLAAEYRKKFALPVVVVGGSNGKTTTKELLASVLKQKWTTLWSEASFNNDIGVPLSLLRLENSHQTAVLEAGTNHPGELAPLVKMIQPRYGILTCIGREHLEFFDDLAGVAQEEGWLAELLPADGKLFVNGDDEWCNRAAERTRAQVVRVGFGPGNDWRANAVRLDTRGTRFQVSGPDVSFSGEYRIHLLGRHQVANALFAIAIGVEMGLDRVAVARGLTGCRPPKMRLELWECRGVRLLDDAYNANADSMLAALQTLQALPCKGRRVAVLGDMAELGKHSEAAHAEVGRQAAGLGVGQLFLVGKMAPVMARAARGAGLNRVFEFPDVAAAAAALKSFVKTGDLVLLKASRVTQLERIVERLCNGEAVRKN